MRPPAPARPGDQRRHLAVGTTREQQFRDDLCWDRRERLAHPLGIGVDDVAVGDLVFGTADFAAQPSAGAADHAVLGLWFPVPAGPTFAAHLEGHGAAVSPSGDGMVDHVLDASRPATGAIAALVAAGGFTVPIARTFPLDRWRVAAELSLSGHRHGKVVLLP